MRRNLAIVLLVLVAVVLVVVVDVFFFRHQTTGRLIANLVIVLAFGLVYARYLKRR